MWFLKSEAESVSQTSSRMRKKRKSFSDDDDVIEIEVNPRSRRRLTSPSQLDGELVDKDYVDFLEMRKRNRDYYYAQSGDYCLDHSPVRIVENHDDNIMDGLDPSLLENLETDDDNIVDPDYQIFLDNVKVDGYSFVLEMAKQDGTKLFLRYEENLYEDTTEDETLYDDTKKHESLYQYTGKEKEKYCDLKPKDEPMDVDSGREDVRLVKKPELVTSRRFLSNCKPGTISSADESYLMFFDHLWVQGDCLIYKNGDVIVRYGDDDNHVTDVHERLGENVRQQGNETRSTPNRNLESHNLDVNEDDSDSVQILGDESVKVHHKKKLEMKLREILSKPFDKKKLKEKWEAAKDRKPLERLKVMHGCDKWFPTGKRGFSYLDRHRDLDKLLRSALLEPVPHRALSLLRCLFFFYENMPHQGSFMPWKKNPPTWLHDIICSCQAKDVKCPMKYRGSHEKKMSSLNLSMGGSKCI